MAGLGLAVALVAVVAVSVGPVSVPFGVSMRIVWEHLVPWLPETTGTDLQLQIVWDLRFPRAVLAILVGAGLSVVGAVLQAVVRNPLADPYLLGVSGGASVGAVAAVVMVPAALTGGSIRTSAAFGGALAATVLVYLLARQGGRVTPLRLVLAGVALAYLFQAITSFLLLSAADPQLLQSLLFWLLGSLAAVRLDDLAIPLVTIVVGVGAVLTRARSLNALLAGDEAAVSLGIDRKRLRFEVVVVTSLMTGIMVAYAGAIAFVGLIVPHAVRLIRGPDHRRLLPVCALSGAVFLQVVDIVARIARPPLELPLSIVTAVIGVPFFVWLLRRTDSPETTR